MTISREESLKKVGERIPKKDFRELAQTESLPETQVKFLKKSRKKKFLKLISGGIHVGTPRESPGGISEGIPETIAEGTHGEFPEGNSDFFFQINQ